MITGDAPAPDPEVSRTATITPDSGRPRAAVNAAPMPTATAGVIASPGRCDAISPAAAPRNSDGKTGPPRKPARDIEYASPLNTSSRARAPTDHVPAPATRFGRSLSPENSTSFTLLSAAYENAI